jgi:hypothetical protein
LSSDDSRRVLRLRRLLSDIVDEGGIDGVGETDRVSDEERFALD